MCLNLFTEWTFCEGFLRSFEILVVLLYCSMMRIQGIISLQFKLAPNKWLSILVPTLAVTKASFIRETCRGKKTAERQVAVASKGPGQLLLAMVLP